MTNSDRGAQVGMEIFRSIARAYGWEQKIVEKTVVAVDPKVYANYTGTYEVQKGLGLVIFVKDARIFARLREDGEPYDLLPESETQFFNDEMGFTLSFMKDAAGKVTSVAVEGMGPRVTAKKIG